jgi:class 3 adenylate cyclase
MSDLIETLTSYVPVRIARRAAIEPGTFPRATAESFPAAVLFADISGFTALAERLAASGAVGAEDLTRLLNAYLGRLVEIVAASGGDVLKFAGDAVLSLWQAEDDASLADAVVAACECALEVQARLGDYAADDGTRLSLKLAVGAGKIGTATLGGVRDRWEFLVAGPPIEQVGAANAHASPGDTICSPEAWALAAARCDGEAAPGGNVRLERVREPVALAPLEPVAVPPEAAAALRAYIPAAIRDRLDAGQSDRLAELRRLTVLYVNLPDLTEDTDLDAADEMIRTLQDALYRHEGSINKLNVDDHGASLLAALGLPPLAHEDDALRGALAALAMHEALERLGFRCSIGVTTGLAFCGSVGGERRREYTIMGEVVNLAARLMQAAMGGVLCDRETEAAAPAGRLAFDPLAEMKVKGRKEPVDVFRPREAAR